MEIKTMKKTKINNKLLIEAIKLKEIQK